MTDPTKPGPDADRIALEREIAACDWHIKEIQADPLGVDQMALGGALASRNKFRAELSRLRRSDSPRVLARVIEPWLRSVCSDSNSDSERLARDIGEDVSQHLRKSPSPATSPGPQDMRVVLNEALRYLAKIEHEPSEQYATLAARKICDVMEKLTALATDAQPGPQDVREALKEMLIGAVCETKGLEDMEAGCCRVCRARAALAQSDAQPQDVLEALEAAINFIADEYRDSSLEPQGEWLPPEARKVHAKLVAALAQSDAQPRWPEIDAAQRRTYTQSDAQPVGWMLSHPHGSAFIAIRLPGEAAQFPGADRFPEYKIEPVYTTPPSPPEGAREALDELVNEFQARSTDQKLCAKKYDGCDHDLCVARATIWLAAARDLRTAISNLQTLATTTPSYAGSIDKVDAAFDKWVENSQPTNPRAMFHAGVSWALRAAKLATLPASNPET